MRTQKRLLLWIGTWFSSVCHVRHWVINCFSLLSCISFLVALGFQGQVCLWRRNGEIEMLWCLQKAIREFICEQVSFRACHTVHLILRRALLMQTSHFAWPLTSGSSQSGQKPFTHKLASHNMRKRWWVRQWGKSGGKPARGAEGVLHKGGGICSWP